jgi:hypothetical protein
MVDSPDNLANYFRNSVDFTLLRHEIDFVMQSLCNLENRINQESIVQLLLLLTEKSYHLLTELLFH